MEKHIERFGDAGVWHCVALHNRFVCLASSYHVVRLDSKDLLKDVGSAECFERPNLHLSETLTTKLSFTTKRLLSDQGVRTDRTCMHLVLNHVTELKHIDHTYCSRLVETIAGATVVKISLAITGNACLVGPFIEVVE